MIYKYNRKKITKNTIHNYSKQQRLYKVKPPTIKVIKETFLYQT